MFGYTTKIRFCFVLAVVLFCSVFYSCSKSAKDDSSVEIAVFIPGIVSGSPVYEMLSNGVTDAASDFSESVDATSAQAGVEQKGVDSSVKKAVVTVIEAGSNQSEWSGKMTALVASEKYDVIITSNPSMPNIVQPLTDRFPNQKFIIFDASFSGNNNIATVSYNQREQSYLSGYISALVAASSSDKMKYSNGEKKIALIAAQEYPVMNDVLLPGFIEGAKAAVPDVSVEFRVVGNWTDASKAAELSRALYQSGVRVILPIAGGGSQGVIAAAKELGFYIAWFDDNGFSKAPGYIISSAVMEQYRSAYECTKQYLSGSIPFGSAVTYGISDGYVDFVRDDPAYIETVSSDIRDSLDKVFNQIKQGQLDLPVE